MTINRKRVLSKIYSVHGTGIIHAGRFLFYQKQHGIWQLIDNVKNLITD
jgi:hypothetical protein